MVGKVTSRLLMSSLLLSAVAAPLAAAVPASAAGPTSVTITGDTMSGPLTVRAKPNPELLSALVSQVSWMRSRPGQTAAPAPGKAGPKFTLVVFVNDAPKQTYDLYPLAQGGPRAFRPAKQPDLRSTTSAWFFGRLNMSETLRAAGVPLPPRPDVFSGGVGGGRATDESSFRPVDDVNVVLGQWRQVYLLNAAVVVTIALGLAGFALLIRRKV
ncbi:MAG TPA: hypothetical protein VFR67_13865 [Pilimelia sp.]|nr:hypothetical protein [Pilimelia sp.]